MGPLHRRIKELEARNDRLSGEVRSLSRQVAANAPSYELGDTIAHQGEEIRRLKGEVALLDNEKGGEYNKRVAAEKLANGIRGERDNAAALLASTRGAYDNTSHRLEVYESEVARLESVIADLCSPPKSKDLFMAIVELANKCAATMVDWTEPLQLALPVPAFAALQNELGAGVALSQSLKSVEPYLIRLNLTIPVVIEDSLLNYDYGIFRNPLSTDPMIGFERMSAFGALFNTTDPDVRAKWAQKASWGKD